MGGYTILFYDLVDQDHGDADDVVEASLAGVGCGVVVSFGDGVPAVVVDAGVDDAVDDEGGRGCSARGIVKGNDVANVDVCFGAGGDFDAVVAVAEDRVHGGGGGEARPAGLEAVKSDGDVPVGDVDLVFGDVVGGAQEGGWCVACWSRRSGIEREDGKELGAEEEPGEEVEDEEDPKISTFHFVTSR